MFFKKISMNIFSVIALGVGAMVGAGIFALLGKVIMLAGTLTYASFIIAGFTAMLSGYSYAKLSSYIPKSGGIIAYYTTAFPNKFFSGILSGIYLLTLIVSISMLAKSFSLYLLSAFANNHPNQLEVNFIAILLISLIAILNMNNQENVGKIEVLLVAIKLSILLVLVAFAFKDFKFGQSLVEVPYDNKSFLGSIGITFFAYAGFGMMSNAAGSVADPQKTIPHAIFWAISIVILLYLSLAFVVINYVPFDLLKSNPDVAVATVSNQILGRFGYLFMTFAALIAFISGINAMMFSSFMIVKGLGTQGILPSFINKKIVKEVNLGNVLITVFILHITSTFNFNAVVNIASCAFLVSYLAVFICNWKLRTETNSSRFLIILGTLSMLFILGAFIFSLIE